MTLQDNGNVGIGTTNPLNSLGFGTGSTGIGFYSSNPLFNQGKIAIIKPIESGSGYGDLVFETYQGGSGGGERMRILNNGNVGIGTPSPTEKLSVYGLNNSQPGVISLESSREDAQNAEVGVIRAKNSGGEIARISMSREGGSSTGFLSFHTKATNAAPVSEAMRINGSGNVGIGTSSLAEKLELGGPNATLFLNGSSNVSNISLGRSDYSYKIANETDLRIYGSEGRTSNASNLLFQISHTTGNVGIGTVNPSSLLEIGTNVSITAPRVKILGYSDTLPLTEWGDGGVVSTKIIRTSSNIMKMVTSNYAGSFSFVGNYDFAGKLGIGTTTIPTDYKLAVAGNVIADKVKVKKSTNGTWPDFVFAPSYKLPSLNEIETFVKQNSHLPEIPSAAEIEKDGQDLGEMNRLLLKKVEELTLYIINQDKEIKNLKSRNNDIDTLKIQIEELKAIIKK